MRCIVSRLAYINIGAGCLYNISRRGLSQVAYPGQGNARARMWDKRTVEHPRLSVYNITNR